MAKPYNEINKTDFRNNYNIVRILTDINDIMNELKTFNPKNQAVAFGVRKYTKPDKFELILERLTSIETRLTSVETDVKSINTRLDNLVIKNNLIE